MSLIDQVEGDLYDNLQLFDNQVMTVKQAAQFLKISEKKLYQLVSKQEVPFKRVGRGIRFSMVHLIEWMKGG
jgi:excisionase family DNA binding protein